MIIDFSLSLQIQGFCLNKNKHDQTIISTDKLFEITHTLSFSVNVRIQPFSQN